MDDLLFKILYIAVTIIAAIVVRYLVPYIKSKIDVTKLAELKDFIAKAIAWAEAIWPDSGSGETRFENVLDRAVTWANEKGFKITEEQVRILIQGIFAEVNGITVNVKEIEIGTAEKSEKTE